MVAPVFLTCLLVSHSVSSQIDSARPRYTISATISKNLQVIEGRAHIRLPSGSQSARLSIRKLRVLRLEGPEGRPVEGRYNQDSSEVTVGPTPSVSVDYFISTDSGQYRQFGYYLFGSTGIDDVWYPTVVGYRFSDFEVKLEVPAGTAVLTTGGVGPGASVSGVEGFTLAFGPEVVTRSLSRSGLTVNTLSPTRDSAVFQAVGEATLTAAEWYQRTYGFFPVSSIGIVPGYTGARGGFPLPNVFMIHRGDLSPSFVRWITSHELAHYYWGLYVLDAEERLGWLSLALGIWTDQLYLARTSGKSLAAAWRDPTGDDSFRDFAEAMAANYDQRLGLPEAVVDSLDYDYNSLVRHGKAATGVYLLAQRLGEDRFIELQRRILREYRGRPLSVIDFGAELARAGVTDAPAFLKAWVKGDASLGYRVAGIERIAQSRSRIRILRTGTIPVPVTIEARSRHGIHRQTMTGAAEIDSVEVPLNADGLEVRIDPEGQLPAWSSDNLEMRRVFVRALGAVGTTDHFLTLGRSHLERDPDPQVAAQVVERLFDSGRNQELIGLAERFPAGVACDSRQTCMAALQLGRALAREGRSRSSRELLGRIEPRLAAYGRSAAVRLRLLRSELGLP